MTILFTSQRFFFANFTRLPHIGSFWNRENQLVQRSVLRASNDPSIQFRTCAVLCCWLYEAELSKKGFSFFVDKVSVVRFGPPQNHQISLSMITAVQITDHTVRRFRHDDIVPLTILADFFNVSRNVSGTYPKSWFSKNKLAFTMLTTGFRDSRTFMFIRRWLLPQKVG